VEKYCGASQATDDNIALARCMLDTQSYKHILRMCFTYCFFTATVVARTASMLRYTCIACLVTEMESVYCAVRTGSLKEIDCFSFLKEVFRKPRSHLKIPEARRLTWLKVPAEDSQMLGTSFQNLGSAAT